MEGSWNYNDNIELESGKPDNLKNRLEDAYLDLENLKRAIHDIKSSNDNIRTNLNLRQNTSTHGSILNTENTDPGYYNEDIYSTRNAQSGNLSHLLKTPSTRDINNLNSNNSNNLRSLYKRPSYQNLDRSNHTSNMSSPVRLGPNNETRKKSVNDVINNFKEVLKESEKHTAYMAGDQVGLSGVPYNFNSINSNLNQNNFLGENNKRKFSTASQNLDYSNMTPNSRIRKGERPESQSNINLNQFNSVNSVNRPGIDLNTSNYKTRNTIRENPVQSSEQINSFVNRITNNTLKDELDRVKISNSVLNKSNLDLKNQNRLLQMELEALQGNNLYNFTNNLNFDQNLNNFIDSLKNALNSSQMSNAELNEIIENLQKKNQDMSSENCLLTEQQDLMKKELESYNKRITELKFNLEEVIIENKQLNNLSSQLELKIKEKDEKISENNEKINNLICLNENYNKNKNDLNEMIGNLKNTIEILKKSNIDFDKEKSSLKDKIEELNNEINNKNYEIENLSDLKESQNKDKENLLDELKLSKEEIKNKEKYVQELQSNYKNLLLDVERNKTKIDTLNLNMDEKECTIEKLKGSLNFITNTLDECKFENEKLKNKCELEIQEKKKIIKNLEIGEKKIKDIQNNLENISSAKEILYKANLSLENEIQEKKNKLIHVQFEYELLSQKHEEQTDVLNKLKEESKSQKLNKISEEYGVNFMKNNDDKNKRINDLNQEVIAKNLELEKNKKSHEDKLNLKDEKIKDLTNRLNEFINKDTNREKSLNEDVRQLKLENENLLSEIQKKKKNFETEKEILISMNEELQTDYYKLSKSLAKLQEENKILQNKNIQLENNYLSQNGGEVQYPYQHQFNQQNNLNSIGSSSQRDDYGANDSGQKFYIGDKKSKKKEEVSLPYAKKDSQTSNSNMNLHLNLENSPKLSRNTIDNITYPSRIDPTQSAQSVSIKNTSNTTKMNNIQICTVYDNKRVLSFDLINKVFTIVQFDDRSDFLSNYLEDYTISVNTGHGLYIVTGRSINEVSELFFYNFSENTMTRKNKLNSSHPLGALIYYNKTDSLICLSGENNKNVEKLCLNKEEIWGNLPEMKYDRINAGFIIINDQYLYALFGFSKLKCQYLNTIERLLLTQDYIGSNFAWEEIKCRISDDINSPNLMSSQVFLESFFTVANKDDLILFGGYDGKTDKNNNQIYVFNLHSREINLLSGKTIPDSNLFSRECVPYFFIDGNGESQLAIFNDSHKVHILDSKLNKYEVLDFCY
jgi:hypothetical protein